GNMIARTDIPHEMRQLLAQAGNSRAHSKPTTKPDVVPSPAQRENVPKGDEGLWLLILSYQAARQAR
ncbi:MAG: hypothetical protein KDI48_20275, partial [Xanthomonadales bacterium]|nr:hypothetical protein [Xanthomonadales bacterium]